MKVEFMAFGRNADMRSSDDLQITLRSSGPLDAKVVRAISDMFMQPTDDAIRTVAKFFDIRPEDCVDLDTSETAGELEAEE